MRGIGQFTDERAASRYRLLYDRVAGQWPAGTEGFVVDTAHGRTHGLRYGTGEPVLLLPGSGETAAHWAPTVPALAGRTVLALDMVGMPGLSQQSRPWREPADMANWALAVLTELGFERADVGGLSYGAWVAMLTALRAPERVAGLLLFEPSGGTICPPPLRLLARAVPLLLSGSESAYARFSRAMVAGCVVDPDRELLVTTGMANYRKAFLRPRTFTDEQLRAITTPSLVLLGERSIVHDHRKVRTRLERLLPDARIETLPGAPHPLTGTHPDQVNALVSDWLSTGRRCSGPPR